MRQELLKTNAVQKTREKIAQYKQMTIETIDVFPDSSPKAMLTDLIQNETRSNY